VSHRAEQLADRLDTELSHMIEFISGLTEVQLDAACQDPQGATVSHVLAHLREGTEQVVAWAASVRTDRAGASPAPGHGGAHAHSSGALHSHAQDGTHSHAHDGTHSHAHDSAHARGGTAIIQVEPTLAQLRDGGSIIVDAIRGLSDEQLDAIPPATEGLADGSTPLHSIVAFIADDVAGHLAHLRQAVAATASLDVA
jgi:DinB superfamily